MQPSTSLAENRVVTVLRWVARVVGVIAAMGLALWVTISLGSEAPGVPPPVIEPTQWALWTILGAGLLLGILGSVFWKGISEVVGGLLLVGGGMWQSFMYLPPQMGQITAGALFFVPGALFIACGWYAIAHHQPRTRHVIA